jgi:hypothetical protein
LRERLVGLERGQEQCAQQVRVGLQREAGTVRADCGFQRVDPGRRLAQVTRPDADHFRVGQAGCHELVLGLSGLDDQPRDSRQRGLLEQAADRLGLAAPGGPAHEHVPVQR